MAVSGDRVYQLKTRGTIDEGRKLSSVR
jgi:hypothetical protein